MSTIADRLRKLDAFSKYENDFVQRTMTGACVSCVSILLISLLFWTQLQIYLTPEISHRLIVDPGIDDTLRIDFDISFPMIDCNVISIDVMDESGNTHQQQVSLENVKKRPISSTGNLSMKQTIRVEPGKTLKTVGDLVQREDAVQGTAGCGSCFGAVGPAPGAVCCNSCEDVRRAYKKQGWQFDEATKSTIPMCAETLLSGTVWDQDSKAKGVTKATGCNLSGYIDVTKVAGSFHFSPGISLQHLHGRITLEALLELTHRQFNLTHSIQRLSFGQPFPGVIEPLTGLSRQHTGDQSGMYQYYVKIVRTEYDGIEGDSGSGGKEVGSNQYSVTEHFRRLSFTAAATGAGLPGVFFFYDFSSIMMRIEERQRSFAHFLTLVCAIVGGVFTVMGMVDGFLDRMLNRFGRAPKVLM